MADSLSVINIHLVFSTKYREPVLADSFRERLHAYIGGVFRARGCLVAAINSVEDHVHILFDLPRSDSIASIVKDAKVASSVWVKETQPALSGFQWQTGYGAFAVGVREVPSVIRYIAEQAEHHRRVTWKDEYRDMLREHGVSRDEKYLWD